MNLILKLFFPVFLFSFISAQTFKNFSSLGGKKDLGVACIAQSKEGILWLGSKEGLIKFNGKTSTLFKKEEGLSNNDITALFIDANNKLWIGHRNGKISIEQKNKIDSFSLNPQMPTEEIISFFEDKNGSIYIGTHGAGLVVYNGKALEKYTTENGLADDIIYSMAYDGKKFLWIGTDAGISEMDIYGDKNKFSHISMKDRKSTRLNSSH